VLYKFTYLHPKSSFSLIIRCMTGYPTYSRGRKTTLVQKVLILSISQNVIQNILLSLIYSALLHCWIGNKKGIGPTKTCLLWGLE